MHRRNLRNKLCGAALAAMVLPAAVSQAAIIVKYDFQQTVWSAAGEVTPGITVSTLTLPAAILSKITRVDSLDFTGDKEGNLDGTSGDRDYMFTLTVDSGKTLYLDGFSIQVRGEKPGGGKLLINGQDLATFSVPETKTVQSGVLSLGPLTSTVDVVFRVNGAADTRWSRADDITLTGTVVPEPATLASIGIAGAGLLMRRRRWIA